MASKLAWLATGLAGGVLATLGVRAAIEEPEPSPRSAAPDRTEVPRLAALERDNTALAARVAALERHNAELTAQVAEQQDQIEAAEECGPEEMPEATPPEAPAPLTAKEVQAELDAFGQALVQIIQGGGQEAIQRLRAFLAREGEPVIRQMIDGFADDATEIGRRVVLAHALAQSGHPVAIKALENTLYDPEAGMLLHRFASHGLAFSDADGIDTVLSVTAHKNADLGARANAAFGLARRGVDEGLPLYMDLTDQAIEKGDPAALQYLGGVTLLGKEAYPAMRERLLVYKEPQALLLLIEVLKARGDKGAVPNLEKLAYDASRPVAVQRAAAGALKVLRDSPK
ncbi:MAG: hypothetical protein ACYTEZ_17640 [Planctomycetota bacterium]